LQGLRARAKNAALVMVSSTSSGQTGSRPADSLWVHAPDRRGERIVSRALMAAVLGLFIVYFALFCFVQVWASDFQVYCAAVARLYTNLLHPAHEAVTAPGTQSFAYSPYLVMVGALGKLSGVMPYRALQLAGIFNIILFGTGAAYFVSRHSMHRRWELSFVCFLFVTLFLRWQEYGWSSETSLVPLQYNQAYPSTFAWALAFFAFGLLESVVVAGEYVALALLSAIVTLLLLTHGLTASWTIGIVGLYALVASLQRRDPRPLLRVLGAFALATGLALFWPYTPLLGQSSLLGTREGGLFGGHPLNEALNLYCIGAPCAAYLLLRVRRHEFWVLGCVATLAALRVWRALDIDYGNRYAFFAMFFAQFIIAEVMTIGLLSLSRSLVELPAERPFPRLDRLFGVGVVAAALVAWIPSPMMKKVGTDFRWPTRTRGAPSPYAAYYARVPALRRYLAPSDVVLLMTSRFVFDVASLTGASFISAPYMVRIPDAREREIDVRVFFDPATSPVLREEIAQGRGATKAVLLPYQFGLLDSFEEQYGPPLYKDANVAVFAL
jgi:hypothetical protein